MLQAEAATAAVNVESTPGRCGVESKLKECRTQASTSRLTESPGSRNLCATPNRTLQRWPDSWTSGCGAMKVNSRRPSKFCAVPSTKIGLTVTSSSHEPDRSAGRRSARSPFGVVCVRAHLARNRLTLDHARMVLSLGVAMDCPGRRIQADSWQVKPMWG